MKQKSLLIAITVVFAFSSILVFGTSASGSNGFDLEVDSTTATEAVSGWGDIVTKPSGWEETENDETAGNIDFPTGDTQVVTTKAPTRNPKVKAPGKVKIKKIYKKKKSAKKIKIKIKKTKRAKGYQVAVYKTKKKAKKRTK